MRGAVAVNPRARRAWPALAAVAFALPATVIIGPLGEALRVREDGAVDELLPGGHPRGGAASDPCNSRRPA